VGDDTLCKIEDMKEPIGRLPEDLYNDRRFCIKGALDLIARHWIFLKYCAQKWRRINSTLNCI
jgi:hypothetical protein